MVRETVKQKTILHFPFYIFHSPTIHYSQITIH